MITVILAALLGCSSTETATAPAVTEAATTPTAVEVTPAATTTTTEESTTCVDITDDGTDQCAQPVVVTSPTSTDSTTSTGTSVTPVSGTTSAH